MTACGMRRMVWLKRVIGVWQQDSGKGPRIGDGAAKLRTRPNVTTVNNRNPSYRPREHCWGSQVIPLALPSPPTRPRENQACGWCELCRQLVSDLLLCTIPLHRPTCILQTESQNLSWSILRV